MDGSLKKDKLNQVEEIMIPLIEDDLMKCPKCHQKVWKLYNECPHCNAPFRRACAVCGEMEMISTKGCDKPLRDATSALDDLSCKIWMFRILGSMTAIILSFIGLEMNRYLKVEGFMVSEWFFILLHRPMLLYIAIMIHTVYTTSPTTLSKKPKIRKVFAKKNPGFAEILTKAEEVEKIK